MNNKVAIASLLIFPLIKTGFPMKININLLPLLSLLIVLNGCSGGSEPPPISIPSSPTGMSVTVGNSTNTVQWNSVSGATSYDLYLSTTSGTGEAGTKISNVSSSYTHIGLINGTTYYYVITASNSAGESTPSAEVSGTPAIPLPNTPTLQGVTPRDKSNLLSWNNVTEATSYNLYWSTVSGSAASGTKIVNATSPYTHTNLTNDTTYYYVLTSVNSAGESSPSTEVSGTPFTPPYATQQYPFHLGTAPVSGYAEVIPDNATEFHYTLTVTPGSTYMFNLYNVTDDVNLYVFNDDSWDQTWTGLECSGSGGKAPVRCIAIAPSSGLLYIRISSNNIHAAENVTLKVEEIVNQGMKGTPLDLGSAPLSSTFGTVLEAGESVYKVAVTAGKSYRVMLTDWRDSGASLSLLGLTVFDGEYTDINGANKLCGDYGGNSSVDHKHRLRTIHCLATPANTGYITLVTNETQYGDGARYDIVIEEALTEGTSAAPVNITADAFVYHAELRSDAPFGYSYYKFTVIPSTSYLVDMRGMHEELEFTIKDSTYSTTICNSYEYNLIDETCTVTSAADGSIYLLVLSTSSGALTDTFILSAIPSPTSPIAPARYLDEGLDNTPILLSLPETNRLSTVGAVNSYYSVTVTPGSTLQILFSEMNVDVDLEIYADAAYTNRLCLSQKQFTNNDNCTVTVPSGITMLYIKAKGRYTTNNGSWSSGTEKDVGAMFRLTAVVI